MVLNSRMMGKGSYCVGYPPYRYGTIPGTAPILNDQTFSCCSASFFNGDSFHAYNFARELVLKNMNNSTVWNLFNLGETE
jgi:hypothetical protein